MAEPVFHTLRRVGQSVFQRTQRRSPGQGNPVTRQPVLTRAKPNEPGLSVFPIISGGIERRRMLYRHWKTVESAPTSFLQATNGTSPAGTATTRRTSAAPIIVNVLGDTTTNYVDVGGTVIATADSTVSALGHEPQSLFRYQ